MLFRAIATEPPTAQLSVVNACTTDSPPSHKKQLDQLAIFVVPIHWRWLAPSAALSTLQSLLIAVDLIQLFTFSASLLSQTPSQRCFATRPWSGFCLACR